MASNPFTGVRSRMVTSWAYLRGLFRPPRNTGRVLCYFGMHHWNFQDIVDEIGNTITVTSYSWCERSGCKYEAPIIVNVETRNIS